MSETSLHAALKNLYAQDEEQQEIWVDGYQIDARRDKTLIEIQTSGFGALKRKMIDLLPEHTILLVHPIPLEKWILQFSASDNQLLYRRRSPRRGRVEDLFLELVYITDLISHPNLQIEVVLIHEEEIRRADGLGSWRRKGVSIIDRHLLKIISIIHLSGKQDFRTFLPNSMPPRFSTQEVSRTLSIRLSLAYKMVYCLRKIGVLQPCGKRGRAKLYTLNPDEDQ